MQKKSAMIHFIDQKRILGMSDKDIQHQLLDAGWHMDIIQHAMKKHPNVPYIAHKTPESKPTVLQSLKLVLQKPLTLVILFILLALLALFA